MANFIYYMYPGKSKILYQWEILSILCTMANHKYYIYDDKFQILYK